MIEYRFMDRPTEGQATDLVALYREQRWWGEGDGADHLAGVIAGSHCFLVALAEERVAAMGRAISDRVSDAYIQDVAVRSDLRGRGIGREIVKRLVGRLNADGIFWIGLIAEKGSARFYEGFGFSRMQNAVPMLWKEDPPKGD